MYATKKYRPVIELRGNNNTTPTPCGICETITTPRTPFSIFTNAPSNKPVCDKCGEKYNKACLDKARSQERTSSKTASHVYAHLKVEPATFQPGSKADRYHKKYLAAIAEYKKAKTEGKRRAAESFKAQAIQIKREAAEKYQIHF